MYITNRLKNDYSQCPDMWQKIQLIVIKIMSLGYTEEKGKDYAQKLLAHKSSDMTDKYRDVRGAEWTEI
ncbi:hypothetical protein [Symbiopectobacterium sp. RP]|uniref:hypothetical protein n=1 Tax=Symbiopectobacterium sp. RP TaxID=3248553 RepID=UPI003D290267